MLVVCEMKQIIKIGIVVKFMRTFFFFFFLSVPFNNMACIIVQSQ